MVTMWHGQKTGVIQCPNFAHHLTRWGVGLVDTHNEFCIIFNVFHDRLKMYWHLRYEVVGDVSAGDAWLGGGGQEHSICLRACKKPLKLKYVCLSFSSKSRQHLSTHIYLDELMILIEKQLNPKFKTYNCQLNHLGIVLLNQVNQNTYPATLRFCWFRHDVSAFYQTNGVHRFG